MGLWRGDSLDSQASSSGRLARGDSLDSQSVSTSGRLARGNSLDSQVVSTSGRFAEVKWAAMSSGVYKCVAVLHGQGDLNVTALALGRGFLYAGSDHGEIRAWGHPQLQEGAKFGGGEGAVKCVVVEGNKVISAHQDRRIRVWRPPKNFPHQHHRLVKSLPPEDLIVPKSSLSGSQRQEHHGAVWNCHHHDSISSLAVGNEVFYSGSWDKSIKVWRLTDFQCVETLQVHKDAVNALAVDRRRDLLYSGSGDTTIKVWQRVADCDHARHVLVATLEARSPVNALALSADGSILYSGQSDRIVTVWKTECNEDGKRVWRPVALLRGHRLSVLCLRALGNDLVVSGSADKTVRVWRRAADGAHTCVGVMTGHSGPVKSLCAASSHAAAGAMVYSGSMDGDIRIWWFAEDQDSDESSSDESPLSDGPVVVNWRSG